MPQLTSKALQLGFQLKLGDNMTQFTKLLHFDEDAASCSLWQEI